MSVGVEGELSKDGVLKILKETNLGGKKKSTKPEEVWNKNVLELESSLMKTGWVNQHVKQSLSTRTSLKEIKRVKILRKSSKRRGHMQTPQNIFNKSARSKVEGIAKR